MAGKGKEKGKGRSGDSSVLLESTIPGRLVRRQRKFDDLNAFKSF